MAYDTDIYAECMACEIESLVDDVCGEVFLGSQTRSGTTFKTFAIITQSRYLREAIEEFLLAIKSYSMSVPILKDEGLPIYKLDEEGHRLRLFWRLRPTINKTVYGDYLIRCRLAVEVF